MAFIHLARTSDFRHLDIKVKYLCISMTEGFLQSAGIGPNLHARITPFACSKYLKPYFHLTGLIRLIIYVSLGSSPSRVIISCIIRTWSEFDSCGKGISTHLGLGHGLTEVEGGASPVMGW